MLPEIAEGEKNLQDTEAILVKLNDYIVEMRQANLGFLGFAKRIKAEFQAGILESVITSARDSGNVASFLDISGDLSGVEERLDKMILELRDLKKKTVQDTVKSTKSVDGLKKFLSTDDSQDDRKEAKKEERESAIREEERRERINFFEKAFTSVKSEFVKTTEAAPQVNSILDRLIGGAGFLLAPELIGLKVASKAFKAATSGLKFGAGLLARFPTFAALGASVLAGVFDAVEGSIKSIDWNVSGLIGGITGFLTGTDSVVRSQMLTSFSTYGNVLKWAGLGAGIGSVFPVIGTIVGGILGAMVGVLMTVLGPEKVSRFIQNTFDTFGKITDTIFGTDFFYNEKELQDRVNSTKSYIDDQNKSFLENFDRIRALEIQILHAKKSGDLDLVASLEGQKLALEERNAQLSENINASSSKLSELLQAQENANKTYLERLKDVPVIGDVIKAVEYSYTWVVDTYTKIISFLEGTLNWASMKLDEGFAYVEKLKQDTLKGIEEYYSNAVSLTNIIMTKIDEVINSFVEMIGKIIDQTKEFILSIPEKTKSFITGSLDRLYDNIFGTSTSATSVQEMENATQSLFFSNSLEPQKQSFDSTQKPLNIKNEMDKKVFVKTFETLDKSMVEIQKSNEQRMVEYLSKVGMNVNTVNAPTSISSSKQIFSTPSSTDTSGVIMRR